MIFILSYVLDCKPLYLLLFMNEEESAKKPAHGYQRAL